VMWTELRAVLTDLVGSVSQSCPELLHAAMSSAGQESANCLRACVDILSL